MLQQKIGEVLGMQVKNLEQEKNNKSLTKRSPSKTVKPIEKQITPVKEVVEMKEMSSHSSAFRDSSSDEADIDDSQNR